MAKNTTPPTVRRRRLGGVLRRLRDQAGLTREDVEERTGVNAATVYRIEVARSRPQKRTLIAMLDLYEVVDPLRSELLELFRTANERGWLQPFHAELPEDYAAFIAFEAEARSERDYEALAIPGLLQTEDYARAMIKGNGPTIGHEQVEKRVLARMNRQSLITTDDPLRLWAIMDEAAVRRTVGGPGVMRQQLQHLIEVQELPNVTIQVIPFDKGAHPGTAGAFVHFGFPGPADPDLVYVEGLASELFLDSDHDIEYYGTMFEYLRAIALGPGDTTSLLATIASK